MVRPKKPETATVIGSGPNGLSAAIVLASAGRVSIRISDPLVYAMGVATPSFVHFRFARGLRQSLWVYRAVATNEDNHVVEAALFRVQIGGEPRAAAEIEEMMWMRVEEARGLALAPLTRDSVVPLVLG